MADYGFMVQTIDITPDMEDATSDQLSQGMAIAMNKMLSGAVNGIKNMPGASGKGELLSHNIVRVGSHLVVSFLFKR
jgi:hypothetical protein